MIIQTKFFDDIEIKDEEIVDFKDGLLGFEDFKKFALINVDDSGLFKCLQSIDEKNVAFVVLNPWDVFKDYDIDIDDNELSSFIDTDINNILVFSIVTITEDKMTANLIGPLVINIKTRQGKQIVLNNSRYTTKHNIKEFAKRV